MIRRTAAALATIALAVTVLAQAPSANAQAAPAPGGAACGTAFPSYRPGPAASGGTTTTVRIPMSDGVALRADLTLPTGVPGPFPTALTITGYGKTSPISGLGGGSAPLVGHGYATLLVDDRGTGASPGTWDAWGPRTQADYTEILDWIDDQSWSDDRVGITGGSYMGITSLFAAASQHPTVKAVFATVPMADGYRDIVFGGGQINTAFIPLWMGLVTGLGLMTNDDPRSLVDHLLGATQFQVPTVVSALTGAYSAYDGDFWRQRSPIEVVDRIQVPTFIVGGLDDIFQRGEPMLYERLADHTDARLLIGPWSHITSGTGLPRDGVPTMNDLLVQWFDQHVRGIATGADCVPKVTQFVRGHERYESSSSWPVPGLRAERWFLRGSGGLTTGAPAATEAGRQQLTLPSLTTLCSRSTSQWTAGAMDGTPCAVDNRIAELGALSYTSDPLTAESVINGPIQADVWITAADRTDAVLSVTVSDVAPDGAVKPLTNGLLTASHREVDAARSRFLDGQSIQPWHPFTTGAQKRLTPGVPTLVPIEVFPTSAAIGEGHRLRITITPFDIPHALPPVTALVNGLGGTVTILNDAEHPSSVVLPVVAKPTVTARSATTNPSGAAIFDGAKAARTTARIW